MSSANANADADVVDATIGPGTFDERAARALTQPMTVLDDTLEGDLREIGRASCRERVYTKV